MQVDIRKLVLLYILMSTVLIGSGQDYSFMTYNIRYDSPNDGKNQWHYRKAALVALVKAYQPQVLGIQEGLHHQVSYMDSALVNYAYVGVGRDDGQQQGEYSALFYDSTKLACLHSGTFWLSDTPEQISVGWDAAMERICTWGVFQDVDANKSFIVLNTHFDHKGQLARLNAASLLIAKAKDINTQELPLVIMGDFNAPPGDEPIAMILSFMEDAWKLSGGKQPDPLGTFNGFDDRPIQRRIDYIFTLGFEIQEYMHLDKRRSNNLHISDHLPVLVQAVMDTP